MSVRCYVTFSGHASGTSSASARIEAPKSPDAMPAGLVAMPGS